MDNYVLGEINGTFFFFFLFMVLLALLCRKRKQNLFSKQLIKDMKNIL